MKTIAVSCALLASAFGAVALAQTPERLARPVASSEMGADGRLQISHSATMGNLIVDQYSRVGQHLSAPGLDRRAVGNGIRSVLCSTDGAGPIAAHELQALLPSLSVETRDALKARDQASLNDLATEVAARLDGISAEAIRADEAIGPDVYNNAIIGFSTALDVCNFFGLEPRL